MQQQTTGLIKIISIVVVLMVSSYSVTHTSKKTSPEITAANKAAIASFTKTAGSSVFLSITDIHFDPFADISIVKKLNSSPVSQWQEIFTNARDNDAANYGSDANYSLTSSAIEAADALNFGYDFILYSGDYLSHDFRATYNQFVGGSAQEFNQFAIKTMQYVSNSLSIKFNDVPVLGTLGNNDAVCGDYMISPKSPLLTGIAPQWANLSQQPNAFSDFTLGGFYKVKHPVVPNHDIIVLNNIFWSAEYQDSCATGVEHPGDAMMAWLEWQLYQSNHIGHTATLLMHVPPGINAYSSSKGISNCQDQIQPFWQEKYTSKFLSLLKNYNGVITNAFTGHTHMDNFRVITLPQSSVQIPLHITPAVSPIFNNNPAFKIVQYDTQNGGILNSATFVASNIEQASQGSPVQWQLEYISSLTYNLPDLSAASLSALAENIVTSEKTRSTFMSYYAAQTPEGGPMSDQNWQAFACAQTNITREDFANCYCTQKP